MMAMLRSRRCVCSCNFVIEPAGCGIEPLKHGFQGSHLRVQRINLRHKGLHALLLVLKRLHGSITSVTHPQRIFCW